MKAVDEERWSPARWKKFAMLQAWIRHRDLYRSPFGTKFSEPNARLVQIPELRAAVFAATYWEGGMVLGDHVYKLFRDVLDEYGVYILAEEHYPPGGEEEEDWTRVIVIDLESKTRTGSDLDLEFLLAQYQERSEHLQEYWDERCMPNVYEVATEYRDQEESFNEWLDGLLRVERALDPLTTPGTLGEGGKDNDDDQDDVETAVTVKPAKAKLKKKPTKAKKKPTNKVKEKA